MKGEKKVKTLQQRQTSVRNEIEKMLGVNLDLTKGGKKMGAKKTGGVQIKKTAKVVPPKMAEVEKTAKGYLEALKKVANFNGVQNELESTKVGYFTLKQKSRILIGVKYLIHEDGKVEYFLLTRESLKNFSKDLIGKYQENNWLAQYPLTDGKVQKYRPLISASIEKYRAVPTTPAKDKKVKK